MKTARWILILSLTTATAAYAGEDKNANCKGQLAGTMDKNKAQKSQEGASSVFGSTDKPATQKPEPSKTDR